VFCASRSLEWPDTCSTCYHESEKKRELERLEARGIQPSNAKVRTEFWWGLHTANDSTLPS
jgi:hypothetical protein